MRGRGRGDDMIWGSRHGEGSRHGLTFKVLVVVPFCIALAIQVVVCAFVLARSEMLGQMEDDAYDLFSERVASSAGYLENDMIFRWSDFEEASDQIASKIDVELAATLPFRLLAP